MNNEPNPPISIAQGIATYLLLEDSRSMKEITHYMLIIRANLLKAHKNHKLDLNAFQDVLDGTENKVWEYETGWSTITDKTEQERLNIILSQTIPDNMGDTDDFVLATTLSQSLLSTDKPELGDEFSHTVMKVTDWLYKAYLIEHLKIEELLACFVADTREGVLFS